MKWHLELKQLRDLKEHPHNPRVLSKHDYQHLKKSLEKFGLIDKPIVNCDGTIIGGHQRVQVLLLEGETECECWVANEELSEKDANEAALRLNRNTGQWDYDILADAWDLDLLREAGFEEGELGLGVDEDLDIESPGEEPPKKVTILECPECKAHFEKDHAKVIDSGG